MNRLPVLLFPALVVVSTVFALNSIAGLPETIAVHLNSTGAADRWMTRDHYRLLVLFVLAGLPLVLFLVMAMLPRYTNGRGQLPNCEYWFAEQRRDLTEVFLISHAGLGV